MLGVSNRPRLTERAHAAPTPYKPGDIKVLPPQDRTWRHQRGYWFTVLPRGSEPSCLNDMLTTERKTELIALLEAVSLTNRTAHRAFDTMPKIQVFLEELTTPDHSQTLGYRFLFLTDRQDEQDDPLIDMIRRGFGICPSMGVEDKHYAATRDRIQGEKNHLVRSAPWFAALSDRGVKWTYSDLALFNGCDPVVYCHSLSSDKLYGCSEFKHPHFGTEVLYNEPLQHNLFAYHNPTFKKRANWQFPIPELVHVIPIACCNADLLKFPLIPYRNRRMMDVITSTVQAQVRVFPGDTQSREEITRRVLYHMFTKSDMFIYDAIKLFLPSALFEPHSPANRATLTKLFAQLQTLPRLKDMVLKASHANRFTALEWISVVGVMSRAGMGTNSQIRTSQEIAERETNIILPKIPLKSGLSPAGMFYANMCEQLSLSPDARPDWYLYSRAASLTGFFLPSNVIIGEGAVNTMNVAIIGETGSGKSELLKRLQKSMCEWQVQVIDSQTARASVYEDTKGFESKHTLVINHEGTLIYDTKTSSTDKNSKTSEFGVHKHTTRRNGEFVVVPKRVFNGNSTAIACNPDLTEILKSGRWQDKTAQLDRLQMITINRSTFAATRALQGKPGLPKDFMERQQLVSMVIQTIADQINVELFSVLPWVACICSHHAEWHTQFKKMIITPAGLDITAPKSRALQNTNFLAIVLGIWRVVEMMLQPRESIGDEELPSLPEAEEVIRQRDMHLSEARRYAHQYQQCATAHMAAFDEYTDLEDTETTLLDLIWGRYKEHYGQYLSLLQLRHPDVPLTTNDIMALFASKAEFAIEDVVIATNASVSQFASDNLQEVARILVAFMISQSARIKLVQSHSTGYGAEAVVNNIKLHWKDDKGLSTMEKIVTATINNPTMLREHSTGLYATTEKGFQPVKPGLSYGDRIVIPVNSSRVDHHKISERNLQTQKILIETLRKTELGIKYGTNEKNYLEAFSEYELIGGKIIIEQVGILSEYLCMGLDFHLLVRLASLPDLSNRVFEGMVSEKGSAVPLPHRTAHEAHGTLNGTASFFPRHVLDSRRFDYRMGDLETFLAMLRVEGSQVLDPTDPQQIQYQDMSRTAKVMSKLSFV